MTSKPSFDKAMSDYPECNLLANALSPYLLQHAGNPVHWREWGPAALAEAEETGKPILLSIGYAACHWCHVMAHESFENNGTAALMNAHFVNIKVDREERPDIDQIYMAALHAMGEQGGWPLTMFLTPAGRPFWGGTYFPGESRYGRPGFPDVLKAIHHLCLNEPDKVSGNAKAIGDHLAATVSDASDSKTPEPADLDRIAERLAGACDPVNGGIGSAPKFPSAGMWENLWRAWVRTRDNRYRDTALSWLSALCRGGIYDHLGGGLHRYTVDAHWLVPHFEKMLYDNAQFVRALVIGHAATGEPLFRTRIEETVDFLLLDMRTPEGGFISSFDADSEGEEGRFYVWTKAEIDAVLGTDSPAFCAAYGVTETGNWENRTILNQLDGASAHHETSTMRTCRARLLAVRKQRIPPASDDKILVDWNALAIRALTEAGQHLDRPDFIEKAEEAFDFVTESISRDGRIGHAYRNGRIAFPGLATDFANMIHAAVTLYGATGKDRYIGQARTFAADLEKWHGDNNGRFTVAAKDQESVPIRAPNDQDEAVPSATAAACEALLRLAMAAGDAQATAHAATILDAAWGRVHTNPFGSIGIVNAADTMLRAPKLLTTGDPETFRAVMKAHPDPARIALHIAKNDVPSHLGTSVPAASDAAYLCRGPVCLAPVFDPEELDTLLCEPATT